MDKQTLRRSYEKRTNYYIPSWLFGYIYYVWEEKQQAISSRFWASLLKGIFFQEENLMYFPSIGIKENFYFLLKERS